MISDELLGLGHRAEVDFLLGRLDAWKAGQDVPRVVVLEGESGLGKSRIVREFYCELVARQNMNRGGLGYWPAPPPTTVTDPDGAPVIGKLTSPDGAPVIGMSDRRKWIGPQPSQIDRAPGTLPEFFWWSMQCHTMPNGTLVDISSQLKVQLSDHLEYLADRWRASVALPGRAKKLTKEARADGRAHALALRDDMAVEAIGVALSALDVAAPGVGILTSRLWEGAVTVRKRMNTGRRLPTAGRSPCRAAGRVRS